MIQNLKSARFSLACFALLCTLTSAAGHSAAFGPHASKGPNISVAQTMDRRLRTATGKLPDKLKLLWKFKSRGPVVSSALVAGGRVFFGSDDGNVYALKQATGTKIWSRMLGRRGDNVQATPILVGGTVVVGSSD